MSVAFLGNAHWSVPSVWALAADARIRVTSVFTRPPVPAGRGSHLTPTPVAEAARELDLPLVEVATVTGGEGLDALRAVSPDVLAVVAYGEILPAEVLAIPRLGPLNLHFSLLPAYRGAAPVQRALLDGRNETGVSVMLMDAGTDTGPVLASRRVAIEPDEDAGTLGARLADAGADLLVTTIVGYAEGSVRPHPQDEANATVAPRIPERDIDWNLPAEDVVNLVRALGPAPGAATGFRGERLKVLRARVAPASGEPGRLLRVDEAGPVVAAGDEAVVLEQVAPAGRRHMSGADFARGARIVPDERFGDSA